MRTSATVIQQQTVSPRQISSYFQNSEGVSRLQFSPTAETIDEKRIGSDRDWTHKEISKGCARELVSMGEQPVPPPGGITISKIKSINKAHAIYYSVSGILMRENWLFLKRFRTSWIRRDGRTSWWSSS